MKFQHRTRNFDSENDKGDEEGPTLVTNDDGNGGIKHIKEIQKVQTVSND